MGNFAKAYEWKLIWEIYNFPFQTHTLESCTNHINGIFTLIITKHGM